MPTVYFFGIGLIFFLNPIGYGGGGGGGGGDDYNGTTFKLGDLYFLFIRHTLDEFEPDQSTRGVAAVNIFDEWSDRFGDNFFLFCLKTIERCRGYYFRP